VTIEVADYMDREAWLAERRKGVGSSDIAAIVGCDQYKDAFTVYLDKVGELPEIEPNEQMVIGTLMEPVIAALYERRTKLKLEKRPLMVHRDHPWMLANLDRVTADGKRIAELKNVGEWSAKKKGDDDKPEWGEEGTDQVPKAYLLQTQWQMEVSEIEVADIAALIGGSTLRIYTVERNRSIGQSLIHLGADFWERVENRRPPQPDCENKYVQEVLAKLDDLGEPLQVTDAKSVELIDRYQAWQEVEHRAEKEKKVLKATLEALIGNAKYATFQDGSSITRPLRNNKGYTVEPFSYRPLVVKRPKKRWTGKPVTGQELLEMFYANSKG
jgi:putative phage-type endonuclease